MINKKNGFSTLFPVQAQKTWAGYASFIWVIVFIAFHVYWAYGGRFGLGDASVLIPSTPKNIGDWVSFFIVIAMFVGGTILPLAMVQSWGRFIPGWIVIPACWIGSATLTIRAVASFLDDFLRSTGLLPKGITGLTYAQITGENQITPYTLWSGRAIDAYFLLGGILYGCAVWYYQRRRSEWKRSP